MADINSFTAPPAESPSAPCPDEETEARVIEAMELLFFAYRDFVGDPDAILERQGFGRAHHRVLHFVGRNPGITVQNLLAILGITKQSLARVLRQLVEDGQVEQRTGAQDRRERHLAGDVHRSARLHGVLARVGGRRVDSARGHRGASRVQIVDLNKLGYQG